VELGHQGRLGGTGRVLPLNNASCRGKEKCQKQDRTETICRPGARSIAQESNKGQDCLPDLTPSIS
jgi:hypothetical protein